MLRDMKLGSKASVGVRAGTVGVILAAGLAISGLRGAAGPTSSEAVAAAPADGAPVERAADSAKDSNSLKFVPRDAVMVARIRPSELLARPEFAGIAGAMKERDQLKYVFGVGVDRVDDVTLIVLPSDLAQGGPQKLVGMIITVRQADDIAALTKFQFPTAAEQEYGNQKYFKAPNGNGPCYLPIDNQTVAIATENEIRRMIVASATGGGTKAKWAAAWLEASSRPAALLVNAASIRATLEQGLQSVPAHMATMFSSVAPLWRYADLVSVALRIDGRFTLEGELRSSSEDGAKKVYETLAAVVTLAKNVLSQARTEASRIPDKAGAGLLVAADVADSALDGIKVERNGQNVRFSTSIESGETALLTSLLVPAVTNARDAARQLQGKNNLKQIGLAMHNFHDAYRYFPAAVLYGMSGGGRSKYPHSWRVALLPFVDHADLYQQYKFDEPWDSESNKKILARMPAVYRDPNAPADSTNSSYFVFVGEPASPVGPAAGSVRAGKAKDALAANEAAAPQVLATAFWPAKPDTISKGAEIMQITDGTSNVLMVVEAQRDIPWTKPEDIPYAADKQLPKLGGHHPGKFTALFCDGSVWSLSDKIDEKTLRNLITINDGMPVKFEQFVIRP